MLIYEVTEKNREANETQVKAGQMVATPMDLKKKIQQAVAEALAQQQPNPPAPAMWGPPPNQRIMHRQQIPWREIQTRKRSRGPLAVQKIYTNCNTCGEREHWQRECQKE